MTIIKKYESRNVPDIEFITFFFDMPDYPNWVTAVQIMKDDRLSSGDTLWHLGVIQVMNQEIDKFAISPETNDPDYETQGWAVTSETFEETIEELYACGFEDEAEIEEGAREFFGF